MSTDDPLTGLPLEFVRLLAIEIDPYTDKPTKPLDEFFDALMRVHSFRVKRKAAENDFDSNPRPKEGRSS
jgi:hypothetical protein